MDITADLQAPCTPAELFGWVEDLSKYPEWLEIVPRAAPADEVEGDPGPAWMVDLRGRIGPFARTKRLRMVRTALAEPTHVRFERRENDGRDHSPWVLDVTVQDTATGCTLTMDLHYGGRMWMAALDRVLMDEIRRSRPRLLSLLD